ncbi:hypothetical protein [Chitiniphilus eburneus]|uniref:Uncharacterized protein n=1 Tax=Chitiniphilus eburneus TaxID=2571148 RepID=A0A4U0PTF3_9NEIS|nr:hypothetical protein [Chitiniphilus eburneus]TJZ71703.1 hypothetical protein FAZ21_13425 [Chitiniphilus eburneus]
MRELLESLARESNVVAAQEQQKKNLENARREQGRQIEKNCITQIDTELRHLEALQKKIPTTAKYDISSTRRFWAYELQKTPLSKIIKNPEIAKKSYCIENLSSTLDF